jgi:acetyl-CoA acetyltransferase
MTRGAVAIVGVGTTAQGVLPGLSADEIAIQAFRLALQDAGINKNNVDGLITCRSFGGNGIDTVIGQIAGMNPRYSATLDYGTSNFSLHLAAMAIEAGFATTVALMYGTNQGSAGRIFNIPYRSLEDTAAYGFFDLAGPAAMAFRRHQYLYGTTEEQLAWISVTQRRHAQLNPLAVFTEPMSLADYLSLPYLVKPLRRPDLLTATDGGACLIVTRADRGADHPKKPVYLLAGAQTTALRQNQNSDQLMRPWIREVADGHYDQAGIHRGDVDVLFIQEATSVWVLQMLEWFGFCKIGEAGAFVEGGRIGLGGELPVNTNGGNLSEAYMWGWLHLSEAVRQLRAECGPRQVAGAKVAQYCSAMAFQKAASSILASEVP